MDHALSPALRQILDRLLDGKSRAELAARSGRLSDNYRAGGGSRKTVMQPDDALAYAVARMPATFAAMQSACAELARRCPDFTPARRLDCGAGPGTAGFAAAAVWDCTAALTQLDHNPVFLQLARHLAAAMPAVTATQIMGDVAGWQAGAASFDLVLLGYALAEFPAAPAAVWLAKLWAACAGALVIVEPGTPAGYRRILTARRWLIAAGAVIAAPCPQAAACPLPPPDWCHFTVRLPRSRDHLQLKQAEVPYEDEPFSYLIAVRPALHPQPFAARVLTPPLHSKIGVTARLCQADGTARTVTVPKRDQPAYAAVKKLRWGDAVE